MTNVLAAPETEHTSKPSSTIEDYLLLIYILQRDGEPVVGARLAELLGVSPPTVSNTLKRMVRDGLVEMAENGTVLSEYGWEAARDVMRRHMLMEWLMAKILPWSKLHHEAHNLEHAISALAETALMEELNYPQTCPHGNPLPGSEEAVSRWVQLIKIPVGEAVTIRRIHELAEEDGELLAFFEQNHILPGVKAVVAENLKFNQTVTITVDDQPITLGYSTARTLFVERTAS